MSTPIASVNGSYPYHSVREDISEIYNNIINEVKNTIVNDLSDKIDVSVINKNIIEISDVVGSKISLNKIKQMLEADIAIKILSQAMQSITVDQQQKLQNELRKKVKSITASWLSRSKKSLTLERIYNEMKDVVTNVITNNIMNTVVGSALQINEIVIKNIQGSDISLENINQQAFASIVADISSLTKTDIDIQQQIDATTKAIFEYQEEEGGIFGLLGKITNLVGFLFDLIKTFISSLAKILTVVPDTLREIGSITEKIDGFGKLAFAMSTTIMTLYLLIKLVPF